MDGKTRWKTARAMRLCALVWLTLCAGCGTRTVLAPAGEPVRLRAAIPRAPVWVKGADGRPVAGEMTLPEGWYCLPDPGP